MSAACITAVCSSFIDGNGKKKTTTSSLFLLFSSFEFSNWIVVLTGSTNERQSGDEYTVEYNGSN
jgi:hypothetical protein